jgi:hypothetical protein
MPVFRQHGEREPCTIRLWLALLSATGFSEARMGRINVAGYGLAIGAIGQALLLNALSHWFSAWLIFIPLLVPWLMVHVVSFCKVAPCRPRRFAQILSIAMAWYVFDALLCELIWLFIPTGRAIGLSAAIAHLLCYGSALCFIVLIHAVREARKYQAIHFASK